MICDCCRRQVDYVRASFWLGDARVCRECFAEWCDPDNDHGSTDDASSIGNFVRLKHGLPPLAAALALSLAIMTSTAYASRHCLDFAEAARTWPTRLLAKDDDGCWTYDHHPRPAEAPASMPDTVMPLREPMLMDRWPDENLLWVELRDLEPDSVVQPAPVATTRQVALLVSLVLATLSVVSVTTGWWKGSARDHAEVWPRQTAPPRFKRPSIAPESRTGAR
jgi:hypothetical protein